MAFAAYVTKTRLRSVLRWPPHNASSANLK